MYFLLELIGLVRGVDLVLVPRLRGGQLDAARFANYEKLRDEIAEAADQLALRSARAAAGSKKPPGAGKRGKRSR